MGRRRDSAGAWIVAEPDEPALEARTRRRTGRGACCRPRACLPARCRVDSSIAWATTLAVPGVPVRTRIRPLRPTVTGTSARIRRSRSSDGRADAGAARSSGDDVDVAGGDARPSRRPRSAISRLTVAWVTSKPSAVSDSTSSPWLPIGSRATISRIARWRARFSPGHRRQPRHGAGRDGRDSRAERRVAEGALEARSGATRRR